ncbi:hypothetical protein EV191_12628 [Tamaricihabitans halophyticus]|uniref:Uncharacterized protein n=1 Tax=Tamaricihabitans halophyticus TaxID=1262583 RepID=A0A4R2Q0Z6_9PSEU|nr:hypothetical protein EV191_12628 [Tamaricihabitans halophyticus]
MGDAYVSSWQDASVLALREVVDKFVANELVAHRAMWG